MTTHLSTRLPSPQPPTGTGSFPSPDQSSTRSSSTIVGVVRRCPTPGVQDRRVHYLYSSHHLRPRKEKIKSTLTIRGSTPRTPDIPTNRPVRFGLYPPYLLLCLIDFYPTSSLTDLTSHSRCRGRHTHTHTNSLILSRVRVLTHSIPFPPPPVTTVSGTSCFGRKPPKLIRPGVCDGPDLFY